MDQLSIIRNKIYDKESFQSILSFYRFRNYNIVFTNGCFDILHRGHVEYLAKAADYGDVLIIGLNSDSSVRRLKGENRPINDQESRALNLAALGFINNVVYFEEDTPGKLIEFIKPGVLVKGADYKISEIVGADFVLKHGGKVETIDFVDGFSTSKLIGKIRT